MNVDLLKPYELPVKGVKGTISDRGEDERPEQQRGLLWVIDLIGTFSS